jgi:hypothetical protein
VIIIVRSHIQKILMRGVGRELAEEIASHRGIDDLTEVAVQRVGCAGGDAGSLKIDRSPCSHEERAQLAEISNDVRGRRRSRHAWSQNLHRCHAELVSSRDLGVLAIA